MADSMTENVSKTLKQSRVHIDEALKKVRSPSDALCRRAEPRTAAHNPYSDRVPVPPPPPPRGVIRGNRPIYPPRSAARALLRHSADAAGRHQAGHGKGTSACMQGRGGHWRAQISNLIEATTPCARLLATRAAVRPPCDRAGSRRLQGRVAARRGCVPDVRQVQSPKPQRHVERVPRTPSLHWCCCAAAQRRAGPHRARAGAMHGRALAAGICAHPPQASEDWNTAVSEKNERLNEYLLALAALNAHYKRHYDVDLTATARVRVCAP